MPDITIIVPAYNEEAALPATLGSLGTAIAAYHTSGLGRAEIRVVDNASTDRTSEVAREFGAVVITESSGGIGYARNAGTADATSPWFFFVDADTLVPPDVLIAIHRTLLDSRCFGGAPTTEYRYKKRTLAPYMWMWKQVARARNMTQGVGQFATSRAFRTVGGYDVALQMAEDTDFYWRLTDYARAHGGYTTRLNDVVIRPSARRLDEWPIWKTLLLTNPVTTRMFLRSRWFWRHWRGGAIR